MRIAHKGPSPTHRPDPGTILHHADGRRTRIFTRAWRDGQDHPTYAGQVWLSIQPFIKHFDSSGSSFVAPSAERRLWKGWVPPEAVPVRIGLVLGPGWSEPLSKTKGKGRGVVPTPRAAALQAAS